MNLIEILHSSDEAGGLCNAVTLSKADKKLSRMMWEHSYKRGERDAEPRNKTMSLGNESHFCYRRLVFHDEIDDDDRE